MTLKEENKKSIGIIDKILTDPEVQRYLENFRKKHRKIDNKY